VITRFGSRDFEARRVIRKGQAKAVAGERNFGRSNSGAPISEIPFVAAKPSALFFNDTTRGSLNALRWRDSQAGLTVTPERDTTL
jgi:hypothetical protein